MFAFLSRFAPVFGFPVNGLCRKEARYEYKVCREHLLRSVHGHADFGFGLFFVPVRPPEIFFHVHMPVNKLNPICGKQLNLHVFTAESKCGRSFALPVHNAIAWNFGGVRIYMQGIAYNTCPARIARKSAICP